jgi:hypothetical protein
MRRKNVAIAVVIVAAAAVLVFFLPVVPVQVGPYCASCPSSLHIQEQGYASVALYVAGYGGIYMTAETNYVPSYVGYCLVYGSSSTTSCGIGVGF